MLIHKAKRKIIFGAKDGPKVHAVIPSARSIMYKGRELIVVPHRLDETKVLRNIGFDVPSPIEMYYDWPRPHGHKPFHAQLVTSSMLTLHNRMYVLNDLGTGKTRATLWAYHYMKSQGRANKMLIVSPLSTLERAWGDEIFRCFPDLTFATLHGSRDRRLKLLAEDVDVYIINHDGLEIIAEEVVNRKDIDVVVIDELAVLRNAGTDRWKAAKKVIDNRPIVWGLTATPTPNNPTDAWGQCKLIRPDSVPRYYGKFRDMVMRQVSQWKWMPRDNALEMVSKMMQPAVRFKMTDCQDLPPVLYETREVELTKEQEALFKKMKATLHAEYAGGQITAANEAVKMGKLIQICSGVALDNQGEEVVIPCGPRIEQVRDIIAEAEAKVIVFVPYTKALNHVADELRKTYSVEIVDGSVSKTNRDKIFSAFQSSSDPRVLVAHAGAMAHGLTLTAANVIIWYAPYTSNEIYEQANGRVTRPGQTKTQLIIHIEGTPLERSMYDRLRKKGKLQGLLLDMIKEEST